MGKHRLQRAAARATSTWPRRIASVAAAGALMVGGSGLVAVGTSGAFGAGSQSSSVSVSLNEIGGSGISGSATYGSRVVGTATGMDPNKRYYSFVYGAGSDATGDNPCILTGETLAGPVNTVGEWDVDEDGNGTLSASAPVPASRAGTMSIREDKLGTGGVAGPLPVNTLVACGDVGPDQDTVLGDVQDQLPALPKLPVPSLPRVTPDSSSGDDEDSSDEGSSSGGSEDEGSSGEGSDSGSDGSDGSGSSSGEDAGSDAGEGSVSDGN